MTKKKDTKMGRPKLWKNEKELQDLIEGYWNACIEWEELEDGTKVPGKYRRPLTITGLAVHIGTNRQTLLNYQKDEDFFDTIQKAKDIIETFAEEQLYTGKNVAGVIFSMINNWGRDADGWRDKSEVKQEGDLTINWHETKNYKK